MKLSRLIFGIILAALAQVAFAGETPATTQSIHSILPPQFAGWQITGAPKASKDPVAADSANAALLKEYGFTDFESATYTRDDGRKLNLKAARFGDASGAYGAFTYYKMPQMLKETIPDQGASLNERVLFYRGNILVDAVFDKLTAMSAAELRDLSQALPLPAGNARNLPALPAYLPKQGYVKNTAKYVVGPVGAGEDKLAASGVTRRLQRRHRSVLANVQTSDGHATLMLISYPTPQIAAEHLRRMDAAHSRTQRKGGSGAFEIGDPSSTSAPALCCWSPRAISQREAQSLLAR